MKIEGAKKIGERYMGFVGLRDPHVVSNVDEAIEWCKTRGREALRQASSTSSTSTSSAGTAC